jgi:hypothetical protein
VAWRIRFSDVAAASDLEEALVQVGLQAFLSESRRELVVYEATDPNTALDWTAVTECGSADELPQSDAAVAEMMQAAVGAVSSAGSARWR